MKILFVAMSQSIHTARWINQVSDLGWDIHLYDSLDSGHVNPHLRKVTVHHSIYGEKRVIDPSIKESGIWLPKGRGYARRLLKRLEPDYRIRRLARLIQRLKPDIIHSLEFQHSSYLVLEAHHWLVSQGITTFPKWIIFDWGNDIYLFNRLTAHKARIHDLLQTADYYNCECERDVKMVRSLGMKAIALPVVPVAGGLDIQEVSQLRQTEKTSSRRIIAVKGYEHWQGRVLFAMRALALCADLLHGYKIVVYSPVPVEDVSIAAELLSQEIGIPVEILPSDQPHAEMLRLFSRSRIYMCANISDGISTAMVEAMSVGAFPIQSNTACADEWVTNGETGLLVPPEDYNAIASAIRRALTDDILVDQAAELNAKVCEERLDAQKIRRQVIDIYTAIAEQRPIRS